MTDHLKLPRALSEEPGAPKSLRPSHQKIIENLDRWANSSELQPPKLTTSDRALSRRSNSPKCDVASQG
jgi:hypothetical protein